MFKRNVRDGRQKQKQKLLNAMDAKFKNKGTRRKAEAKARAFERNVRNV